MTGGMCNMCLVQGENIESLLPGDSGLKIVQGNCQGYQVDTVNVITTKKHLKFGNSITAEWMANDQLSISDISEGHGLVCFVKLYAICMCIYACIHACELV